MENNAISSLAGSKIVIIGGSSGIGFATAKAAAQMGAHVIIASGNPNKVAEAIKQLPETTKGYTLNATDESQIQQFFDGIGEFDHMVYTAGENLTLNVLEATDMAVAKDFFTVRYWGAFTAVKYAAKYCKGSIVLTGGIAGQRPGAGWTVAASICSAMEGLTRALAVELAPLRVNLVAPGVVRTPLWDSLKEEERQGIYSHYEQNLPVKFVAEADDIAKTYIYLMGQKYSTGQAVVADGGGVLI